MLLHHFLECSADLFPEKTFLVDGGRRLTFGEVEKCSNRLAHALREMGLGRGERVSILLENSPETIIAVFGVLKADGVFSVLSPTIRRNRLSYILDNSDAQILIAGQGKLSALSLERAHAPRLRHLVIVNDGRGQGLWSMPHAADGLQRHSWDAVQASYPADRPLSRNIDVDLASIIYTSGSTGAPKGVTLSHLNMVTAARSITTYLENRPDDIILSHLPLSFDYGLYQALMAAVFGGTLVMGKSFLYLYDILRKIEKERVTGLPLVPTMVSMLLQLESLAEVDLSSLRYVTNTSAALPVEHIHKLRARLPRVAVYSMYGLTECKRVSYLPPWELDKKPGSVGRAMPNTEAYIVNNLGQRLPPGEVGELVVRGAHVMQGYWKDPETTSRVLQPGPLPGERVLYTGDLFRMDEDGCLYFIARRDDMIKTRGELVSPKEVEDRLHEIEGVAEAAVVGVPDPVLGQAIKAFVLPTREVQLSAKEIVGKCAGLLEPYMIPKEVEFVDSFPRTTTGKIDKKILKGVSSHAA